MAFALATPALADEGWVIQRFASDITIQNDASLRIVEAIDVDFGAQQKHGIFRNIAVRYRWDDTHLRVYRLEVRSVTDAAEKPIRFALSDAGADKVIKIGDPDRTVSGRHMTLGTGPHAFQAPAGKKRAVLFTLTKGQRSRLAAQGWRGTTPPAPPPRWWGWSA